MTSLALLEAALEASQPGGASDPELLETLLVAWRATPAPAIADLVDAASQLCASRQPSLVGDTAAHHEAWLAVAREGRPADLERLLEGLVVERAPQRTLRRAAAHTESRSRDELLAAVYDAPDDDGARLVYADVLTHAGDPRGEFIVLQYQRRDGTISRDGAARERALSKQYTKAWLGPMDALVRRESVRFDRGFPDAVRFVSDLPLKATSTREWATVTEIDLSLTALSADGTLFLVHSPNLRSLDAVLGARPEFFQRLLSGRNEVDQPVDPSRHRALLERLRRLGGRGAPRLADLDALLGLFDRAPLLDEVHWVGGDDTTIPLLVWALQNAPAQLARFVHGSAKKASVFTLERGEEGLLDRLVMPQKSADWRDVAERVAAKGLLREVVIPAKTDDAIAAALEAACARSGVEVRRGN